MQSEGKLETNIIQTRLASVVRKADETYVMSSSGQCNEK